MRVPDFVQIRPEALAKIFSKGRSLPGCASAGLQVEVDPGPGLPAVPGSKLSATPLMQ